MKKQNGITLIALVVTIVILLILAGVSISMLVGDNGVVKKSQVASTKYKQASAEEKLAIVLSDGEVQKHTEGLTDEQLDEKIEQVGNLLPKETEDSKNQYVVVDGYLFEVDRTVPKIGRYVGESKDIAFPTVNATAALGAEKKDATITITALEEKKGITKIEIWQAGEMLKDFTYDNVKTEITQNYEVTQNGKYVIRACGEVYSSTTVEVTGIIASVRFEPNGNNEWQQGHQTVATIQETSDRVSRAKYCWINSVTEPVDTAFSDDRTFVSGAVLSKTKEDKLTGTYYIWTMLETLSGEKVKWRSEGFNFDNSGPSITAFASTAVNYSSFKLNMTAIDEQSGIAEYEFFVRGVSQGKNTVDGVTTSISREITVSNASYGDNSCYLIVRDKLGNETRKDITAQTQIDTTGPNITKFTATKSSATAITLSVTAQDTGAGTTKFEFYVDNTLKSGYTQTFTATTSSVTKSVTITGLSTGSHSCMVKAYDARNNVSSKTASGSTKLYTWTKWSLNTTYTYKMGSWSDWSSTTVRFVSGDYLYSSYSFNSTNGTFSCSGSQDMCYGSGSGAYTRYRIYNKL